MAPTPSSVRGDKKDTTSMARQTRRRRDSKSKNRYRPRFPSGSASSEQKETITRKVEKIKGNFKYILSRSSKKNFKGRRSIYVSKEIKKNEIITQKNIKVVRPGTGLHPKFFRKILGRKSRKKLFLGERLSLKHIF